MFTSAAHELRKKIYFYVKCNYCNNDKDVYCWWNEVALKWRVLFFWITMDMRHCLEDRNCCGSKINPGTFKGCLTDREIGCDCKIILKSATYPLHGKWSIWITWPRKTFSKEFHVSNALQSKVSPHWIMAPAKTDTSFTSNHFPHYYKASPACISIWLQDESLALHGFSSTNVLDIN